MTTEENKQAKRYFKLPFNGIDIVFKHAGPGSMIGIREDCVRKALGIKQFTAGQRHRFLCRAEVTRLIANGEKENRVRFRTWLNNEVIPSLYETKLPAMIDKAISRIDCKPKLNRVVSETVNRGAVECFRYSLVPVAMRRRKPGFIVRPRLEHEVFSVL